MKVSYHEISPNQSYRIRGHRHFGNSGLDVYLSKNPFPAMYAFRFLRIGTLQTGDRIRIKEVGDNFTKIIVSGYVGWVHTNTLKWSILKPNKP